MIVATHDPARTPKRTLLETRELGQQECREFPCQTVHNIINGDISKLPPCGICVHEAVIRKIIKGRDK